MSGVFDLLTYPMNEGLLTQVEDAAMEGTEDGVALAMKILFSDDAFFSPQHELIDMALRYLKRYADWRLLNLRPEMKRRIAILAYESEAEARAQHPELWR